MAHQPSILAPVPQAAAFLFLNLRHDHDHQELFDELGAEAQPDHLIVGFGPRLIHAAGREIPGLRPFPRLDSPEISLPWTPFDLFLRVDGADPGEVLHRERELLSLLCSVELIERVDGFMHRDSRDLTGYEDGTENPVGEAALGVAFQSGGGAGLDGSSVVAIQRWVHDLDHFDALPTGQRDDIIGRHHRTNEELSDAPESAHVKRTAQEDFTPEAFMLRRSMPWRDPRGAGLVFLCFATSLDPFAAQLRRMVGLDDGIVDALFRFTRPVSGGVWWCPPLHEGRLDCRALR